MQTDWFTKWSKYQPHKTAVSEVDTLSSLSYQELNNCAKGLCQLFQKKYGLQKGDRVLIIAPFTCSYIPLLGVAQKMGIILVPVNYRLSAREVAFMVENAAPSLIFIDKEYQHLLNESHLQPKQVIAWEMLEEWVHDLKTVDTIFDGLPIEPSHPALILYTSGTTGFPKGAIYTHGMMVWNSFNTAMRLSLHTEDRTLMVMPPFHTGGWNVLTTPLLHFGGTVILMPKFSAEAVLQLVEEEKISIFMMVPTMVRMVTESPQFEAADFSSLRYLIVGGEALPISLIETWDQKGVPIRQGYGLTEAGPNITSLEARDNIRKRGSIGFPNFYVQHRLVTENENDAQPNEPGELWIKGPIVTPGYWKNPEATRKALVDGWFRTGDILIEDEEGYLFVVDRIKNLFISGGENVYPAEIEKHLLSHNSVREVAVIGVPDEKWGEVGMAFIVLKPGEKEEAEAFKQHCQEGLAKFKIPKYFQFIEELPKNETGKIDRKKLSKIPLS